MSFKEKVEEQRGELGHAFQKHAGILFTILILLGLVLLGQIIWGLLS